MRPNHVIISAAALALGIAGAHAPEATAPPGDPLVAEPYTGDDFYAVPDPYPEGEPGTLVRYEPVSEFQMWEHFGDDSHSHVLELFSDNSGSLFVLRDAAGQAPGGGPDDSLGASVSEVTTWLEEHPGLQPVDPIAVTVAGLDGVQIDVAVDPAFTDTPDWCPPDEVCVPLVRAGGEGEQTEFSLFGVHDVARLVILEYPVDEGAAENGTDGNITIVLDAWDWARADAETFYAAAADLLATIELGAEPSDPDATDCTNWWGEPCHGPLTTGESYATFDFEPAFSYTAPEVPAGAAAWRIMYLSESVGGEPIVVTGVALVPQEATVPEGGSPILSVAHGTTGIGDDCAISKDPTWDLVDFSALANDGYLVAYTDYEGLGTPGRHPYLVGVSEGRGVLDAAKAATQLPGADAGTQLALWGHSQGGHAALFAGELAAEWAPEFDLVGVVAGAPAAELDLTGAELAPEFIGFIVMVVAGYDAAYDDIDPAIRLTPEGVDQLGIVDEECDEEILEHFAAQDRDDILLDDADVGEAWNARVAENNPGQALIDAPVLVVDASDDEVIPTEAIDELIERMCGHGQVVERQTVGGDHGDAWWDSRLIGLDWIPERVAGTDPVDSCR